MEIEGCGTLPKTIKEKQSRKGKCEGKFSTQAGQDLQNTVGHIMSPC